MSSAVEKPEKAKSRFHLSVWLPPVIAALLAIAFVLISGFRFVTVEGSSMDTTLESGEKLVVTNFMYTPQTGDIIVVSKGEHYDKPFIKRVIATEGQTLQLDYANDKIYVDGKELDEPYLHCSTFEGRQSEYEIPTVIPKGKLFVMGDNRAVSRDSRSTSIGLVDVNNIIGKAHFAVFPFNRFGAIY